MDDKTLQKQVAEKQAEIVKLEAEIEKLRQEAMPKYPKHIKVPVPDQPDVQRTTTVTVNSEEEEKAAFAKKPAPKVEKYAGDK